MDNNDAYRPQMIRDIVFREEDDGAFLFDPIRDELRCINEPGVIIYKAINGKNTVEDIVNRLAAVYPEVKKRQIRKDVGIFIQDLQTRGYLEDEPAEGG